MIATLFKVILILCCLLMLTLKRKYKPAVFIFGYAVLSEVSLPLPMGNTVFFLPIFYIFTEGLRFKEMIKSFRIKELVFALIVFAISFLYNYANSPHYWGSVPQFVTLLFRECITTYFILVVGFFSLKDVKTFKPFLQVAFISLIILTVFGVINYITKESTMLDLIAAAAVSGGYGAFSILIPAVLLVSALLTAGYLLPPVISGFFPKKGYDYSQPKTEAPPVMTVPMLVLSIAGLLLGVFGQKLFDWLSLIM